MTAKILIVGALAVITLPLIHPFGRVRSQRSDAPLPNMPSVSRVCQNCHSERTEWPSYSRIPVVSWMLERDVSQARAHLNLSLWDSYSSEQKEGLLALISAAVRSHQMPPQRYLMLHPEARLSAADIEAISKWAKEQRHILRLQEQNEAAPKSPSLP